MTARTDPHRKGAIIPANYRHVLSYNLDTTFEGFPCPSFGINCELDRQRVEGTPAGEAGSRKVIPGEHNADGQCCIIGLRSIAKVKFSEYGTTGKCTVCGAHFVYGDVWAHEQTGEHIHLGHDCADKYNLLADRSEYELGLDRARRTAAANFQRELTIARKAESLAKHPGLGEALQLEHHVLQDLAHRFNRSDLSEKQVALVFKLANEIKNPPPPEKHVPAPSSGRIVIEGEAVSIKSVDSQWGYTTKVTVKVHTPDGTWLAWGTLPSGIKCERGDTIRLTASVKPGRAAHFCLFSRPSKASVTKLGPTPCNHGQWGYGHWNQVGETMCCMRCGASRPLNDPSAPVTPGVNSVGEGAVAQ